MNKKNLIIGIAILMVAIVTVAAALFLFPYKPDQPPQTDDTGSTEQGIKETQGKKPKMFIMNLLNKIFMFVMLLQ